MKINLLTNEELLAKYYALIDKVVALGVPYSSDMQQYEKLLEEIYLRKLKPERKIVLNK